MKTPIPIWHRIMWKVVLLLLAWIFSPFLLIFLYIDKGDCPLSEVFCDLWDILWCWRTWEEWKEEL